MATLTIRQLDEQTKDQLRVRAAHNRRSMEEEARGILRGALADGDPPQRSLADAMLERFGDLGGVDLELPRREPVPEPPTFS